MRHLLALVLLSLAAHAAAAPPAPRGNRYAVFEPLDDGRLLMVVGGGEDVQWYLLPRAVFARGLLDDVRPGLRDVDAVAASPDGAYLAVLTYGEGHPWLQVIDLIALVQDGRWLELSSVDPYPGYLSLAGWLDDRLLLTTDVDLARLGSAAAGDDAERGEERLFALTPATGQLLEWAPRAD